MYNNETCTAREDAIRFFEMLPDSTPKRASATRTWAWEVADLNNILWHDAKWIYKILGMEDEKQGGI